jgi:hypothetical protein
MEGLLILVPFVLTGIFLRLRWLTVVSILITFIGGLTAVVGMLRSSGPGTYDTWAAIALFFLVIAAVATMWISFGAAWIVRKLLNHSKTAQ